MLAASCPKVNHNIKVASSFRDKKIEKKWAVWGAGINKFDRSRNCYKLIKDERLSADPAKETLEVLSFGVKNVDGVIGGVGGFLEDSDLAAGVLGSRKDDLLKKIRGDIGGTGGSVKKPSFGQSFHGPKIDIFIGP